MSPDQLTTVTAILDSAGALPIGTLLIVMAFGPWIFSFFLARAQERRFFIMKKMYEDNVLLVERYEKIADDMQELIISNTQAMTQLRDKLENIAGLVNR